jgi:microcystin-dependent protein
MSTSFYTGEIVLLGFNFAPVDFLACEGQLLPISEYEALFNLIGTTYGGDGQATFALPDLRGRVPIHWGTGSGLSNYVLGEAAGAETHTLLPSELPLHNHVVTPTPTIQCQSAAGTSATPVGHVLAREAAGVTHPYSDGAANTAMAGTITVSGDLALASAGGAQPHDNLMPVLAMTYAICVNGVFPSQT